MKVVVLSSKSSYQDLLTYGAELVSELKAAASTTFYDQIEPDFSNIPELFDADEKLVLFNHFALPDGFTLFSQQLPKFQNVRFLLSPYSAYEGLDLDALKARGIHYRNNGGANANSVAQYAVMAMFSLLCKVPVFTKEMKMPNGSVLGEEFYQKTAGIIGMGNVGRELARILESLGIPVVFYNRSMVSNAGKQASIDEVMQQDLVFVTIATNDQTKELLKDFPERLQPHQYVIDVSATDDLYDKAKVVSLLESDKLRGYALEVFDPAQFAPTSQKNLLVTPHIAWCTIDAEKRTVANFLQRALTIVKGKSDEVDFIV
jgi:phosphoglycerate dehydrogenase-like enzyme